MNTPATRLLLAGTSVLAGAAVLAGPAPLAVAGGLLLAFVLPGYALTGVVAGRRALTGTERVLLGPALSLALVVVGGLVLFAAGVHLNRPAWTVLTVGTTLLALTAAALRDRAAQPAVGAAPVAFQVPAAASATEPASEPANSGSAATVEAVHGTTITEVATANRTGTGIVRPGTTIGPVEPTEPPSTRQWLLRALPLVLALAVLGGAAWLSLDSNEKSTPGTVTALSAEAAGPVGARELRPVKLTVTGLVRGSAPYRIVVTGTNGSTLQTRQLDVESGSWTATLLLPARERLAVNLYRSGDAAPYRTTLLSRAI
jgi:hypothetical protein